MKTKIVEMTCTLAEHTRREIVCPAGFTAKSLENSREDDLYPCYLAAFQGGDSKLFMQQREGEQREFYETLAFEQARNDSCSSMILKDEQIVGFTYVLPYGEKNQHISCMWNHAQSAAALQGLQSMTLWTEVEMGAYQLYIKHGFKITEEKEL